MLSYLIWLQYLVLLLKWQIYMIWVSCLIQLSEVFTVVNTEASEHIEKIFDLFGVKDTNYFSTIWLVWSQGYKLFQHHLDYQIKLFDLEITSCHFIVHFIERIHWISFFHVCSAGYYSNQWHRHLIKENNQSKCYYIGHFSINPYSAKHNKSRLLLLSAETIQKPFQQIR